MQPGIADGAPSLLGTTPPGKEPSQPDNTVCMARRDTDKFPDATPLLRAVKHWPPPWELPGAGVAWDEVIYQIQQAVHVVLDRPLRLVVWTVDLLTAGGDLYLHEPCGSGNGEQHYLQGFATDADVVIVRDNLDILLISCRPEVDDEMRSHLRSAGCPAAATVVEEATNLPSETVEYISTMASDKHNPATLGHSSAGVTLDFGLHDGQLLRSSMLSCTPTSRFRPPSTKALRAKAHMEHRDACRARLTPHQARCSVAYTTTTPLDCSPVLS